MLFKKLMRVVILWTSYIYCNISTLLGGIQGGKEKKRFPFIKLIENFQEPFNFFMAIWSYILSGTCVLYDVIVVRKGLYIMYNKLTTCFSFINVVFFFLCYILKVITSTQNELKWTQLSRLYMLKRCIVLGTNKFPTGNKQVIKRQKKNPCIARVSKPVSIILEPCY